MNQDLRLQDHRALDHVLQLPDIAAAPPETAHGRKIAVRFKDGELLCGYSLAYTPDREGFFIFPTDADSNKMRVYVVTSSTAEVKVGPAAETLALRMLGSDPRPRKKHPE